MAHYAKIVNNIVTQVIVAEADFFDSFIDTSPGKWIQTSYNTHAGVHSDSDGTPLRKNFAGIGFTYDETKDAFIPPKRYLESLHVIIVGSFTRCWFQPVYTF